MANPWLRSLPLWSWVDTLTLYKRIETLEAEVLRLRAVLGEGR